jgi:trimethylamine corrinoid protein
MMEAYKSGKGDAMKKEELFARIEKAIIDGRKSEAVDLAREAVKAKLDLTEVIEKGYVPGIQKVGALWEKGDYFLPELITSAECMKAAMAVLQPELDKANIKTRSAGKVVIGTVEGDIHDIGKSLVASMLSANGFDVIDLGADVKLERFIDKAEETKADFICLSALLTTTMLGQKKAIELLKEKTCTGNQVLVAARPPIRNGPRRSGRRLSGERHARRQDGQAADGRLKTPVRRKRKMIKTIRPKLELLSRRFIEKIIDEAYEILEKQGSSSRTERPEAVHSGGNEGGQKGAPRPPQAAIDRKMPGHGPRRRQALRPVRREGICRRRRRSPFRPGVGRGHDPRP